MSLTRPYAEKETHFKEFRKTRVVHELKIIEDSIKAKIQTMDAAHRRKHAQQARKQQQRLISKQPKRANKENFSYTSSQPRAGLQALPKEWRPIILN